jgi:hypothetical protein
MNSNDDFEDLIESSNKTTRKVSGKKSDSLGSVFVSIGQTIPFKAIIFIFIVYILINSDCFLQKVLFKLSKGSTTDGVNVVSSGVILQALIMAVLSGVFLSLDSMNLV